MKKFFSVFLVLSFITIPVYAQVTENQGASGSSGLDWAQIKEEIRTKGQPVDGLQIPYLEARSIELSKNSYASGDVVEGVVVVRNSGTIDADGIVPTISLIGDHDGFVPTALFDSETSDQTLDLAPGETKSISFAYNLPEVFLSNDLAIQVEFYTSTGLRQDSISKKFFATGEIQNAKILDSKLLLRDREYDVRTTPTVYDGDSLNLLVEVSSSREIIVQPSISLHDFSAITGAVVSRNPFVSQTVSGGTSRLSYEVNVDIPMGLYEGVATFTNQDGVNVIPPIRFLFIKSGDGTPFMIRNITVESQNDSAPHIFNISYTSGAPDIDVFLENPELINQEDSDRPIGSVTDEDSPLPISDLDFSDITVQITVKDKEGRDVAQGEVSGEEAGEFIIKVPVDLSKVPSDAYSVTARAVNKNGNIVGSYEKDMFIETSYVQSEKNNMVNNMLIVIGLIILIILISIMMKLRKARNGKGDGMGNAIPTVVIALLILTGALFVNTATVDAYTRLEAGSVWDQERMIQEFGGPRWECFPNGAAGTCQNNNSQTVQAANSTAANRFIEFLCVEGKVCQDWFNTELNYMKSILGPGSRLGNALIPSVTSVRIYDQAGNDLTYDGCVQPGEKFDFIISSEHRTCGTRALMTHYEIEVEGQVVHARKGGGAGFVTNYTGGFTFTAPLLAGEYTANIAVLNPANPWYYYRGFVGSAGHFGRLDDARGAFYTYELGQQTINVCAPEDDSFRASCIASPIQVKPGEEVTFTARAAGGSGSYAYEWGDGDTNETKTVTYNTIGSGTQTLKVRDSAGNVINTQCAVTVTNDVGLGIGFGGGTGWTWDAGWAYLDPAEIVSFGADRLVTNDICVFEWETTGMASCRILKAGADFIEVDVNGSMELPPGTYTLECMDKLTFDTIKSQPVRCIQNIEFREI